MNPFKKPYKESTAGYFSPFHLPLDFAVYDRRTNGNIPYYYSATDIFSACIYRTDNFVKNVLDETL